MAGADGAGAVWAQIIAWDLLIGQWMFLEARSLSVRPAVTGPLPALTILLSPFALPVFLVLRAARTKAIMREEMTCAPDQSNGAAAPNVR